MFDETFVCLMRRDHPAAACRLTAARFADLPHLLVAPRGGPRGVVDRVLEERGLRRRVARTVASFVTAPYLVAETDLVLTAPARIARRFAEPLHLAIRKPPLELTGYTMQLAWHRRHDSDPAHAWLREQVRAVSKKISRS